MNDPRESFVDIITDELGACPDKDQVLAHPSMEGMWSEGLPRSYGDKCIQEADDLTWWFIAAFVDDKEEVIRAKRAHDAVARFFFDLAKLSDKPSRINWDIVHALRRRIILAMWPTARQIAIGAKKHPAAKAARLIERLTTEEEWQTRF